MSINKLDRFAPAGEKTAAGLDYEQGFPKYQKPARQWFNKLFYDLTEKANTVIDAVNILSAREHYQVGDLYITVKSHASGESVAAQHGYGAWARFGEGKALVGLSTAASDPEWTKAANTVHGEYEHNIATNELPADAFKVRVSSNHSVRNHGGGGTSYAGGESAALTNLPASETGWNGNAIDMTQPSIVVEVWVRTA